MGLDLVELVIATEAAFGVAIPDEVAATLDTPRKVVDYLEARLTLSDTADCLTQRAFYRIRASLARRFETPRISLTPSTHIGDVLPANGADSHWRQLGAELGADQWPKWRDASWLRRQIGTGPATLGDLAEYLATSYPAAVKGQHGWTHPEIEQSFLRVLVRETAIDMSKYTLDSRFVRDMGLD